MHATVEHKAFCPSLRFASPPSYLFMAETVQVHLSVSIQGGLDLFLALMVLLQMARSVATNNTFPK